MNRSKTLLILSGAIPSVALVVIFLVAAIPPGPNLVAHWKFDEGKDLIAGDSIDKNTGRLMNGPIWLTSTEQCVEKGCLNLDGANDYVIVPRSSSIEPKNAITISMWVNVAVPRGSLVDKAYTTHSAPFYSYNLQLEPKTGQPDKAELIWSVNTRGVLTSLGEGLSEVLIDLNSWQYVTVVYDGAEMREYVNGQLAASTPKTGTIPFYDKPLMIGAYSNYAFFTNAIIDDLRIYDNALTEDQIQQLYKEGSPPVPRPMSVLLSHWGFDEGADVTADDKTGNGNQGTLMGNPIWLSSTQCATGGSCLEFDGVDDVVVVKSSPTLNLKGSASFSISLWLKSTQSGAGDRGFGWLVDHRRNNDGMYAGHSIGDASGVIAARISDAGGNDVQISSTRNVNDGKWHHIVYVVDRYTQQIRLYIDNTLESSDQISSVGTIETPVDLNLGGTAVPNTEMNFYDGALDQVRIYSGALTSAEILHLYEEFVPQESTTGLMGHWKFDEGAGSSSADSSGNGNIGILYGPTWTTECNLGSCLDFDGLRDFVSVRDSPSLNEIGELTVSAWLRPEQLNLLQMVVVKGQLIGDDTSSYGLWMTPSNQISWAVDTNEGYNTLQTSPVLDTSRFHFVVGTYKSGEIKLYLDGSLVVDGTLSGTVRDGVEELTVGKRTHPTDPDFFNGQIDDVRVYNRALTAQEVQQLYDSERRP